MASVVAVRVAEQFLMTACLSMVLLPLPFISFGGDVAQGASVQDACIASCPSVRGSFGSRRKDSRCVLKCMNPRQTTRARTKSSLRSALSTIRRNTLIGKLNPLSLAKEVSELKSNEKKIRQDLIDARIALAKARRDRSRTFERAALRKIAAAEAALKAMFSKKSAARLVSESMKNLRKGFSGILGHFMKETQETKYGFYRNPLLEKQISGMLALLRKNSLRPGNQIAFKILNTKKLTHIAATDGETIYIDKAYLDMKPSQDELMFVLSHEMGHADLDHLLLKLSHYAGLSFEEAYFPARISAKDPRVKKAIERTLHDIEVGQYSQDREREADLLGARTALAAGISPRGIKEFIDRMVKLHGPSMKKGGRDLTREKQSILKSSHPQPLGRLRDLERALGRRFWER
ncbi:MAG: M48 family metalloprotease [Nitrospinaceae bacterium]|nr:M48 family metalloprotease [Nitrospinaceae bacterium]MBT3432305.1 M48 family metalloprotease [Nitrospinaceae bacterium]MBT3820565.1 M48 family metalloprotease [Nitrospinaceae bacterium]MBT4431962.1 M48 family metalloprotease [Nitrospinaceae bacterium]MBT5369486.1 M48 family metalloprotease [Nitrospinaceae bacterium]